MKTHKSSNDERIAILETNMSHIQESLQRIENQFERIDKKFDKIDNQFCELRKEIIDVKKESWSQFRWIIGFICVLFGMPIIQNIVTNFIGK